MKYLNKEIEALVKRKKGDSLAVKRYSCGIFQELEGEPIQKQAYAPRK